MSLFQSGELPPVYRRVVLGLILATAFFLRVVYPDSIYLNVHAERDIWRSILILQGDRAPYLGSELTIGGYTFGPALHLLQMPPLLVSFDPRVLLVWLAILHTGAIFLTFQIGRELISEKVGLAAAALFATWPMAVIGMRYLWNPSYMFPLIALFYWALSDVVKHRRTVRVPVAVGTIAALVQIHMSSVQLLVMLAVMLIVFRPAFRVRDVVISAAVLLVIFSPYIIGEIATGFGNTRALADPPKYLRTANGAVMPLPPAALSGYNLGAMQALQVVISPVFYDMRYLTGTFSYLHLLAEFGPGLLPAWLWELTITLHRIRWFYVVLLFGSMAYLSGRIIRRKSEAGPALFFLIAFVMVTLPPIMTRTMTAPDIHGNMIGVGATRYFYLAQPLPFLIMAMGLQAVWKFLLRLRVGSQLVVLIAFLMVGLQTVTLVSHFAVSKSTGRSIKYGLFEAFNWRTQRAAAEVLIDDWGVTPEQFSHRFAPLDLTFDSRTFAQPWLEQGLDYAYFTHPRLNTSAPAKYPNDQFRLYDARRTATPDLTGITVIERRAVGDLILLRVSAEGYWKHSLMQNPWELIRQPDRMKAY